MAKLTPQELNSKGPLHRALEVRASNAEDRTVELAFSSEAEIERWFGIEVLDHSPGAIRLERLRSGAPLLVNHDRNDQVGVVESVTIGEDRKGRAVVRFGRSARAQEVFQDVADGIRRLVSVGYIVHGLELAEKRDGVDVYRVTDWEPFEISIVSVPADPSVGVGRELENPRVADAVADHETEPTIVEVRDMTDKTAQNPAAASAAPDAAAAAAAERERARSIAELGERFGAADLAARAIADGESVESFQRKLLDRVNEQASKPLNEQARAQEIGMTDKEVSQFSFLRLMRHAADPADKAAMKAAGFEIEACRAAAEKANKQVRGLVIPADVLTRAVSPFNTGTSGTNTGDTGGFSVATTLQAQSFVEMLRNRAVLLRKATALGGLLGNVDIPRQVGGATAGWIGEDEDSPNTGVALDQISLSPKTVSAYSEITRRLLMQSSLDVELMVRRDLAKAMALAIDLAGFYGTGTDKQPRGIINYAGINAVPFAQPLPTYAELVAMETEIAADNADVESMAYVLNARMRGHCKTTPKFGSGTESVIWERGNTVNGYAAEVTNQIANGDVLFGNWADLIVGLWGGLEMTVDPYTHSTKGRIRIVTFQDVDFVLRRAESFCLGRKPA